MRPLLDVADSARAWLFSWGSHVGNCRGGGVCTCGLTAIRSELSLAIEEARTAPEAGAVGMEQR